MVGPYGCESQFLIFFIDPQYRDIFGLRPDLMNCGVSRDEIDMILYNRTMFTGINKVLDRFVDRPLSRRGQNPRRFAHVPN